MKKLVLIFCLLFYSLAFAQAEEKNFITLIVPEQDTTITYSSTYRLSGSTAPGSKMFLNDSLVDLYPNGVFAGLLQLKPGENSFIFTSILDSTNIITKNILIIRKTWELKPTPRDTLLIEDALHLPESDLILNSGEVLTFRIKGTPGCTAKFLDKFEMTETTKLNPQATPGIYVGRYKVKSTDTIKTDKIFFTLTDSTGKKVIKYFNSSLTMIPALLPLTAITKGERPYLNYGLGKNRLGGAKLGFIRPGIHLRIIGKHGKQFKVLLAKDKTAWIPENLVTIDSLNSPATSLTGTMTVWGNDSSDFVSLGLSTKLPYSSHVELNPTRIIVDVYGATSNTNWLIFRNTAKEIESVNYIQASEEDFRIIIKTKHNFIWGYSLDYNGSNLILALKHRPEDFDIDNFVFAIDPGHGGRNNGAKGSTGVLEKNITFAIARNLKSLLEEEGAKVIMTREKDTLIYNSKRLQKVLKSDADILISIHANSIGLTTDPRKTKGTATFYKYIQFAPLAKAIFKRMVETGLAPYGYVGKFNFTLNSLTELPNALVETAFLSNPEDEMKLLDENFRKLIAEKIMDGIEDFLDWAEDN